jgi:hypothetical protein
MKRKLYLPGVLFFTVLTLGIAVPGASAEWFMGGSPIAEGHQATETQEEVALEDSGALVKVAILCKFILEGNVGPNDQGEITEVLNTSGEKIGTNLSGNALLCSSLSACEGSTDIEIWPDNLPWLTELELMESAPHILNRLFGGGAGKEPGWEAKCLVFGLTFEDLCEGGTSSTAETTSEKFVLEIFNPAAPISSQNSTCTQGGEGAGKVTGEGLISLTNNGKLEALLIALEPKVIDFDKNVGKLPIKINVYGGSLETEKQTLEDETNYKTLDPNSCILNKPISNCTVEVSLSNANALETGYRLYLVLFPFSYTPVAVKNG